MFRILGGILIGILTCSCVTMNYTSKGRIPVHLNLKKGHTKKVQITNSRTFYLWGTYPNEHFVELDKEFQQTGAYAISGLQIFEKQTFADSIIALISFGLVIPRTYVVDGYRP